jgi:hypothetical protein
VKQRHTAKRIFERLRDEHCPASTCPLMRRTRLRTRSLQAYPTGYILVEGGSNATLQFQKKGGPFMSDSSNSLRRYEEMSGTESAEPPSSYGRLRL